MNNIWYLFVIGYIILNVVFRQNQKKAINSSKNESAFVVLIQLLTGLGALVFALFFELKMSTNYIHYIMLLVSYFFYALYDIFDYKVRKNLEVSMASVLSQMSTIFIMIIGFTLLKEPLALNKIIGALFIIAGNILVLYKKGKIVWNKYIIFAVLANFFNATALRIDAGVSSNFNYSFYVAQSFLVPALIIMGIYGIGFKEILKEYKNGNKLAINITSLSWGLSIIFMLIAYELNSVTVVAPLCALGIIFNVFASYFFQNEKSDIAKKIIATILVVIGIIFIK